MTVKKQQYFTLKIISSNCKYDGQKAAITLNMTVKNSFKSMIV